MDGWRICVKLGFLTASAASKGNAQIAGKGGTKRALNGHFRALKTGEGKRLGPVMLYGQQHYLEAIRLTDGQLLMVCSDEEGKGIEAYGERWQIGTLFGSLKSKQGVMDKKGVFFETSRSNGQNRCF